MTLQLAIVEDDLTDRRVLDLLQFHLDEMHRWSPPESVHAMPAERLRQPDVTFFSAWDLSGAALSGSKGGRLAGCGAIKHLDDGHGELKSMRAANDYRGKGVGKAILLRLMEEARARGYLRVSLETGRPEPFHAAHGLYRAHGFEECAPFGSYEPDPFSLCMTRAL